MTDEELIEQVRLAMEERLDGAVIERLECHKNNKGLRYVCVYVASNSSYEMPMPPLDINSKRMSTKLVEVKNIALYHVFEK